MATGEMTIEGGKVRVVVSSILYMALSIAMGGTNLFLCSLLWVGSSILHNLCGWGDHFVTKNYFTMSSGSIVMLLAAREIAGDQFSSVIPPILAACWLGLSIDSQDLRDVEGDRVNGRQTTSVLLGVENARKVYVAQASATTAGLMYIMRDCVSWPDAFILVGILAHFIRTLSNTTVEDDHLTYKEICLVASLFFCRSAFWAQSFY